MPGLSPNSMGNSLLVPFFLYPKTGNGREITLEIKSLVERLQKKNWLLFADSWRRLERKKHY